MVSRSKKRFGRMVPGLPALLCLLLVVFSVLPVPAFAEAGHAVPVRVGYYENEVFQEGAEDGAIKSGYAYEYIRKISEYTGWKYDYVYGEFGELYQKLLDGEIDLLAGLAWKEERADLVGYPELPMGNETYNLVKHISAEDITIDPATIEGRTIGVLDSAMVDILSGYLADHHVTAEVKTYRDYSTLLADFDAGKLDLMAAEGDGTYGRDNAEVLVPFGTSDYFLCVSKTRPDLLRELDKAQKGLAVEEPNWLYSLAKPYDIPRMMETLGQLLR